jgi:putative endonuclease
MTGYTYILKCANGAYYIGSTTDLERRMWEHDHCEGANFTKKHLPVKLVYVEEYNRIDDAFNREQQLKGWTRAKKEALINGDKDSLKNLSKSRAALRLRPSGSAQGPVGRNEA